ncbi:hypothetical protein, partial [Staphylococcus aureus]|uniref:hypothetical protein n=1 Tax=Staphylococcus aureus TaxID=1280 RepID=UPI001F1A2F49
MRLPRFVLRTGIVSSIWWATSALAITTGAITASVASQDCLAYRGVGVNAYIDRPSAFQAE